MRLKSRGQIISVPIMLILFLSLVAPSVGQASRIRDIASIGGVRENQLIGYGLIVGLAGTGDNIANGFTRESLANMLTRQGLSMKDRLLKSDNVAAVMITASLPPFARIGSRIDVMVSSIGDAESLQGGTLLLSPLRGVDGEIYALAQGPVSVGGFTVGRGGAGVMKNHTAVARIVNGATVERELVHSFNNERTLTVNLNQPNFTNAVRTGEIINREIQGVKARALDASTIVVDLQNDFTGNAVHFVAMIENLKVPVEVPAVVVLNERTGTVVMGENVRISTVAVAHGNLSIIIREEVKVHQPLPFAPPPGKKPPVAVDGVVIAPGAATVVTVEPTITVEETKTQLMVLQTGVTIQEVVKALNAIGVSPRDLIAILQTIKAAGAMQADIRII